MITDRHNQPLDVGDVVSVRATIEDIAAGRDDGLIYELLTVDEACPGGRRTSFRASHWQTEKVDSAVMAGLMQMARPAFLLTGRSPAWRGMRDRHLVQHPSCAARGGRVALEVHHKLPVHLYPEMELTECNLVTLCMAPGHWCHFAVGHAFDWKAFNSHVAEDAARLLERVQSRSYE